MTTTAPPSLLPHLWKSTLISGILALVLGALVAARPGVSVVFAAVVFGAYLLITGVVQVVHGFSLHTSAGGRVLLFISGAAALILALLCFRSLPNAVLLLAIWIGVGFIFRGVATTISAVSDPTVPGRIWHAVIGVITLLAGVVTIVEPFSSIATLAFVVGIWLMVIGVFEIVSSFGIRRATKTQPPALTGGASTA
jgi:uncharacterized membrane protein HdeD (DUF308 family)